MNVVGLSGERRRVLGLLLAVALGGGGLVRAQSTTATIRGTVRDPAGRSVPEAVVQAQLAATGTLRNAITDLDGTYQFVGLSPGEWMVVARTGEGGTSETRTTTLGLQQVATVDLTMGSGLTEQVTVTAESPVLDPQQVGGKHAVSGERADALPIAGRQLTDLALLDASVKQATPGNFYGERGSVFVLNGQSGRANSFLVDGLDNNDQTSGTSLNSYFSQQVIKEFTVLTHQYSAEFGRASGGILNVVTEHGTNVPFAEAFLQGTSDGWNSSGNFVDSLPDQEGKPDAAQRFAGGFNFGGAFEEDKSFYFLAYEHQASDDILAYTGIDRDGVPGGWMVGPSASDNLFFRMDFNLDANNSLMVRLSGDDRETDGLNVGGIMTPEAGFTLEEQDYQLGAALTTVVSPTLLNEARLLVGTSKFHQFANSDLSGVDRPGGVFGGNQLHRQLRDESRIQLLDNVTLRRGTHTMKFGADVTYSETQLDVAFNPSGSFLYDTGERFEPGDGYQFLVNDCLGANVGVGEDPNHADCPGDPGVDDDGDGLIDEQADRLTYPVVYTQVRGDAAATLTDSRIAIFGQDSWQASPKLLLDYGLRYDLTTYTLPANARVDSTIPNGGAERDYDNLAPRFGFTYVPGVDRRFVMRGGVGVFYDKFVLAFPAVAAVTSGTEIGLLPLQGFGVEITEEVLDELGPEFVEDFLFFPESLTLRFSTGTELDTPYAVQANLGVEQAVGRGGSWSANVVRVRGYNLPVMRDLNPVACFFNPADPNDPGDMPDPQDDTCAIPDTPEDLVDARRIPVHLDPDTGSIAAVVTEGESWYTGLDLAWRWSGKESWFQTSYTISRAEDLGPDPLKGGIYLPPDSSDLTLERARSDHDRRHRFVAAAEGPIPWGGLRISGVLNLASGAPFNVTTGQDDNLDGIKSDRLSGMGRNTGENTDLDAVNALRAEEGLEPATKLDEPSFAQLDLRLWKPFGWGARKGGGQIFLQVFNVLDRDNYAVIEGRVTAPNFGSPIVLAGPPRTLELGVQVAF
jgi:hypothetical protein